MSTEDLTKQELLTLLEWGRVTRGFRGNVDEELLDKIKQAIADKEFEEKRLQC